MSFYVVSYSLSPIRQAGCSLDNVVRTRMYVTDIKNAEKVMAEHCKVFSNIRPAATLVSVSFCSRRCVTRRYVAGLPAAPQSAALSVSVSP